MASSVDYSTANPYTEKDWKLFRQKLPQWQEDYMERLEREYITLLSGEMEASEKFWALEKRIRSDKNKAGVCARMSRSRLVENLVNLLLDGVITMNDMAPFSQSLKDAINLWMGL